MPCWLIWNINFFILGILEKLDYIQALGFETVYVQTVFKSPFLDGGYDISDNKDVNPMFGTMKELKNLIDEIHKRGRSTMFQFSKFEIKKLRKKPHIKKYSDV